MRKITTVLIFFVVGLSLAFGQTTSDSISIKKVFGGYELYQDGEHESAAQCREV